jgi:AbrB family looped-hinge helix DNA binding protein
MYLVVVRSFNNSDWQYNPLLDIISPTFQEKERSMPVSTVSSKGQVTLPAQIRKQLGIGPNDRVTIDTVDDAIVIRRAPDLFELKGFLGKHLPEREEREQMQQAAATHVKGGRR